MNYDPEARRDTPLARKLKERIRRDGPISVGEYMRACLQDESLGYYRAERAIGAKAVAVATGATGGARRAAWVARLALAPTVLVAFDADPNGAGDQAAAWWLSVLANGRRLRPVGGKDVNAMHTAGLDVRAWVAAGLR